MLICTEYPIHFFSNGHSKNAMLQAILAVDAINERWTTTKMEIINYSINSKQKTLFIRGTKGKTHQLPRRIFLLQISIVSQWDVQTKKLNIQERNYIINSTLLWMRKWKTIVSNKTLTTHKMMRSFDISKVTPTKNKQ